MQYRLTGLTVATLGSAILSPAVASAQTLELNVTLPRINSAEYHKPYVAIWLEKPGVAPRTIAVWYDFDLKGAEGAGSKWLRDMRAWWRVVGRTMTFPEDSVTGATKGPGSHKQTFVGGRGGMPRLTPGNYTLAVEAAREVGGREVVRIPFVWNGSAAVSARGAGTGELGSVSLTLKR